jgi:hypothetical protein
MKKLIVIVAAMLMGASFAYAGDWNFYGSARVSTFWTSVDDNSVSTADVDNFAMGLQGNSRFGATVKVSDELTGGFEYGTGVNLRKVYGEWNFGGGSFLVGQTYTPLCLFYSNQVFGSDTDLLGYGGVYSGRQAMLRLKFGGFQVALTPAATAAKVVGLVDGAASTGAGAVVNNAETDDFAVGEVQFPAIEAKYNASMGAVNLAIAGGYQSYEVVNGTTSFDIDSYAVALGASANFGMFRFGGNVYTGQNPGDLIWIDTGGSTGVAAMNAAGTAVLDTDVTGWLIVATAKLNDMFSVEFGYAAASAELDGAATDDDVKSYYGQAVVTLAPGVYVIPEIGVIDFDETSQNTTTYYGAKWQINF